MKRFITSMTVGLIFATTIPPAYAQLNSSTTAPIVTKKSLTLAGANAIK
jgi:hypothetical protein